MNDTQEQRAEATHEIVVARAQQAPDSVTRYPGMQSSRETLTVAGGVAPSGAFGARFPIRSIRVDNFSNQWLQIGEEFDFVPPGVLGWRRNVRGKGTITVQPIAPAIAGITQAVPTNGEQYMLTMYDKPQLESAGEDPGVTAYINIGGTITNNLAINPPTDWPGGWQVMDWESVYACSATVGTRNVRVEINGLGGVPLTQRTEPTGFTAGSNNRIMVYPGTSDDWLNHAIGGAFGTEFFVGWPAAPVIPPGGFLEILDIHNIDAGDVIQSRCVLRRLPV